MVCRLWLPLSPPHHRSDDAQDECGSTETVVNRYALLQANNSTHTQIDGSVRCGRY